VYGLSKKQAKPTIPEPSIADLITFEEAARVSGFTTRHLRKLAESKQLWAVKLGRNWFTTEQAIKEYLSTDRKPGPKTKKADT
jgi:excisionase family DNA binding protein